MSESDGYERGEAIDMAADRLERLEAIAVAAQSLTQWAEAAVKTWEGGPMPSEGEGRRALFLMLDALQAAGYET